MKFDLERLLDAVRQLFPDGLPGTCSCFTRVWFFFLSFPPPPAFYPRFLCSASSLSCSRSCFFPSDGFGIFGSDPLGLSTSLSAETLIKKIRKQDGGLRLQCTILPELDDKVRFLILLSLACLPPPLVAPSLCLSHLFLTFTFSVYCSLQLNNNHNEQMRHLIGSSPQQLVQEIKNQL